jgi:ribosomal protein L29
MDIKELKELDVDSLMVEVSSLQEKYATQQEAVRNGKEKNSASLRVMRRDIARAMTLLKEKQGQVD